MRPPRAIVSLGANLGSARVSISAAASMIAQRFGDVCFSSLLTTPAIGGPGGQGEFFNAVAAFKTQLDAFALWNELRQIEATLGRVRRQRWESRHIDLDILMFGDRRVWTTHLKIPHPRMVTRSFALLPAAEICPETVEPVSRVPLRALAARLPYRYEPAGGTLTLTAPGPSRRVLVLCDEGVGPDELRTAFAAPVAAGIDAAVLHRFDVRFESAGGEPAPRGGCDDLLRQIDRVDPELLVVAVRSPDPLAVAWEDSSTAWAEFLGLRASPQQPGSPILMRPKYLLNCDDIGWAAHELHAALAASCCPMRFAAGPNDWINL